MRPIRARIVHDGQHINLGFSVLLVLSGPLKKTAWFSSVLTNISKTFLNGIYPSYYFLYFFYLYLSDSPICAK